MAEPAIEPITFTEFASLKSDRRYELVDGSLEELVAPTPLHGFSGGRIFAVFDAYLEEREPEAFWGVELDIPTIPYHGRRPDFVYYSTADAEKGIDLDADAVTGVPTLVAEVISADDERRDLVVKRREYALAGIPHYWILDPRQRTVLTLRLNGKVYEVVGQFSRGDVLRSELFPGLEVPVARLFRGGGPRSK